MKAFSDLYDFVLPDVRGCVPEMANVAIKNALIEFLERSHVWTFDQTTNLVTVALQSAYPLTDLPAGTRVVQILNAYRDDDQLVPAQVGNLTGLYDRWQGEQGIPRYVLSNEEGELVLVPKPTTGGEVITATASITYLPTVTSFEDWIFNRFYRALVSGAKAELFAMKDKPWSNPDLSGKHMQDFEIAIGDASMAKVKGFTSAPLRSRPVFR